MGKYATDPVRVLITMIVTYVMFTFVYLLLAEFGDVHIVSSLFDAGDPRELSIIGKAFYHSAITFLTIGYGDYYPDGSDACEWCYDWCAEHECPDCGCAHSHCFNPGLKN